MSGARPPRLPEYDIRLTPRERWSLAWRAWRTRLTLRPTDHWARVPREFAAFRRFVRNQVLCYSPDYFAAVRLSMCADTRRLLAAPAGCVFAFIHHGFFPAIAFVVKRHFPALAVTTIGTAPARNLDPRVNPDHDYWKYAFYHQARRCLGQRFIFSDEPVSLSLDWLGGGGGLAVAIDVAEEGHARKKRPVAVAGRRLALPETATRLARLSRRPVVAASLFHDGERPVLHLGEPFEVRAAGDEAPVLRKLCDDLFAPYRAFPEQRFFDIIETFALAADDDR